MCCRTPQHPPVFFSRPHLERTEMWKDVSA
jgi:hypothetical protein